MRRRFCLEIIFGVLIANPAFAQNLPKIEIGSIMALTYRNGQSGNSPLLVNDGDASFNSDWVLLFGAEINESISLFAEVQTVRGLTFVNYGLSAIYQPPKMPYLNFEVGKFLAPFGSFLGRRWASENPLIGFPLVYEYVTSLSAFDLPANSNELLGARGGGGAIGYHPESGESHGGLPKIQSGHLPQPGSGLRIASREVYFTGAQLFGVAGQLRYYLGVANGALSNPADINNTNGLQLHGRLGLRPLTGLEIGSSFSWGAYLDKNAVNAQLEPRGDSAEDFRQTALGFDLTYSIGHVQLFSEFVWNSWESPFVEEKLNSSAFYVESKYTFFTRFFVAGRFNLIDFGNIDDPLDEDADGRLTESWEFDIHQWEVGLGFRVNRNALIKAARQINRTRETTDGDPRDDLFSLQAVVFF
jgi:hypothetical protein